MSGNDGPKFLTQSCPLPQFCSRLSPQAKVSYFFLLSFLLARSLEEGLNNTGAEEQDETEMKEQGIAGPPRETQISIASSSSFPGFKFSPTDEELISYYLKKKMEGCEKSVEIISEVEICQYEPWDLPC